MIVNGVGPQKGVKCVVFLHREAGNHTGRYPAEHWDKLPKMTAPPLSKGVFQQVPGKAGREAQHSPHCDERLCEAVNYQILVSAKSNLLRIPLAFNSDIIAPGITSESN